MTWISHLNRNTKQRKAKIQSSVKKFKNGNLDIKQVKKVRPKNLKI